MKLLLLPISLCGSILFSTLAPAEIKPLITKTNYSGYTRHDYASNENCQIFADSVVINHTYGGAFISETRPITSGGIYHLIGLAARDKLSEQANTICDGASTSTQAELFNADGSSEAMVLYSTGGCGHPRLNREGGAAHSLRSLIDTYCPRTH